MTMTVVLLLLLLLPFEYTQGECHVCNTKSRCACHDATTFSICINGTPTNDYISCPDQYHCTSGFYICYKDSKDLPDCPNEDATDPNSSSTPTTTTATTISNKPLDPDTICADKKVGSMSLNESDPTCKTYVICRLDAESGSWEVVIRECGDSKWFNSDLGFCFNVKPSSCT